jgi:TetR/AcrR family transcriptional regulator
MQASSSDATETARALKSAGRKLFATHGFDGASVRAITHDAGANLGAITYHYGSKRGLYAAVLDDGIRPLADRVVAAAEGPGTPLDRILMVVQAYFEHFRKNPDLPRLMLQEISAGRRPPDVVIDLVQRIAGTIRRLQEEGEADGSVRAADPFLTAPSVVAQPIFLTLVTPLFREISGLDLRSTGMYERMVSHTTSFIRAGLAPGGEATP